LLEEFVVVNDRKPRYYRWFTATSSVFIFFLIVDFTFDVAKLMIRDSHWELAVPLITIPVLGIIGHLVGHRVGWITNFLYYFTLTLGFGYGLYTELSSGYSAAGSIFFWRITVFLTLASISVTLLLSREMRRYFRVGSLLLFVLCLLSISFVVILTLFV
jgi:hypothetical protein